MELTEELVRRSAKQYDIEFVHHAILVGLSLNSLGNALKRCTFLTVLEVQQNKLVSLDGIEAVGKTLLLLNAAENQLTSLVPLTSCSALTTLYLEGNELAKESDILPITQLPSLREVRFKRMVKLELEDQGFCLDNPFCANPGLYHKIACGLLSRVLWVDGVLIRRTIPSLQRPSPASGIDDPDIQRCLEELGSLKASCMNRTPGEIAFQAACHSVESV